MSDCHSSFIIVQFTHVNTIVLLAGTLPDVLRDNIQLFFKFDFEGNLAISVGLTKQYGSLGNKCGPKIEPK